ncbi:MAG: aminotransferase class IV [Lachnospiraceae bacterium]|nr:aminotransferase class IV [Lachnospiraceae bacterium]
MKNLGYYNGRYGLLEEMMIPMDDRVCWFGDGVYDAGPCHNYHMFALDEHIDRFFRSAEALDIEIPVTKEELAALLKELVQKLDTGDLFVYFQVTRGTAIRDHVYEKTPGNLWVMLKPGEFNDCLEPLKLITTKDTRFLHCNIKTLNLIPSVMAAQKARQAGCDEAVFYRPGGRITECAHSNVHILKDGVLRTAPADNLILPGIARAHLLRACQALGIPVAEEPYYLPDLFGADEVIVSSSSHPCARACEIDGKPVGGKDPGRWEQLRSYLQEEFYRETE